MGCSGLVDYRLFKVICCFCFIVCMVTSCSSNNDERAGTSFRPVPYQQPASGYPYPAGSYRYRQPYYGAPNSRSHYNPYDFQQPYGSNPYSDYDQYYVPPVQYYNNEFQDADDFSVSPR